MICNILLKFHHCVNPPLQTPPLQVIDVRRSYYPRLHHERVLTQATLYRSRTSHYNNYTVWFWFTLVDIFIVFVASVARWVAAPHPGLSPRRAIRERHPSRQCLGA